MSNPNASVNAWIFLNEDHPDHTHYATPGSCYQTLIDYGVYEHIDMLNMCFCEVIPTGPDTVPAGDGSYFTIRMGAPEHNQPYMEAIIADARRSNPNIKLLVTLLYANADMLTQILSGDEPTWQAKANAFAANLRAYLEHWDLDGFDVDWESPLSDAGQPAQFALLFSAIRTAFGPKGRYLLTLSPAAVGQLDAGTVNSAFDFVTLQLYSGFTDAAEFIDAGVSQELLAYGAKFESDSPSYLKPTQDAQGAYAGYSQGNYTVATQWRVNSGNFQYEQAQQMILYRLVHGPAGPAFDDGPIVGVAGTTAISSMTVRSGEVLDAIQVTSTGSSIGWAQPVTYALPQHGGNGGHADAVSIAQGDGIASVSGYTGTWFGWECVLQLTITTKLGQVFGPYGTMANASSQTPFSYTAPADQTITAFSGSIVQVPEAGGGSSFIVASLTPSFG